MLNMAVDWFETFPPHLPHSGLARCVPAPSHTSDAAVICVCVCVERKGSALKV